MGKLWIPKEVSFWLIEEGFGSVRSFDPVGGGCINQVARLTTQSGQTFFIKTNRQAPQDMFLSEAEGLNELRTVDGPRFPQPLLTGPQFLLIEDLNPAPRTKDYWTSLGRQLAALHAHEKPQFGFFRDNYIGGIPQLNPFLDDGYRFFANHRLNYQAELAGKKGLLIRKDVDRVADIASRLTDLIPEQPASLLHGDLWSGNIIADEHGQPALIDPAVYFGWAEADLAMTLLFSRPPEKFFDAYLEIFPLQSDWRGRFPIYNLYHLLNHLNLFGRSYYGQIFELLKFYGC